MMAAGYALPDPHSHLWQYLTSHLLMDRYGMTEILTMMANPLHATRKRGKLCPKNISCVYIFKIDN